MCSSPKRTPASVPNGGGCAIPSVPDSVYVGPFARVLGGNVTGTARIEDHAVILPGATVSGGVVGALRVLSRFTVSGSALVQTTFYPPATWTLPPRAASSPMSRRHHRTPGALEVHESSEASVYIIHGVGAAVMSCALATKRF